MHAYVNFTYMLILHASVKINSVLPSSFCKRPGKSIVLKLKPDLLKADFKNQTEINCS